MRQAHTRPLTRPYRLAMLLAAWLAVPAAGGAGEPPMSSVEPAVPQALLLRFLSDRSAFTLIDARTPEEYAASHIDGAVNVPHDQLERYEDGLPAARDGTVVVYCRTGKRAGKLKAQLIERGYSDVRVLEPDQVFSSGDLMVFNCGAPASKSPAATDIATVDAREEERER